jgi:hypothetical protein
VYLRKTPLAICQFDPGFSLHLSPSTWAEAPAKNFDFPNASAEGNGFNGGDLADESEIHAYPRTWPAA